jgi:hypothetical protein
MKKLWLVLPLALVVGIGVTWGVFAFIRGDRTIIDEGNAQGPPPLTPRERQLM